jgi:hypothetical protein
VTQARRAPWSGRPTPAGSLREICPLLAVDADHRTAYDRPDPEHRCHALRPPGPLTLDEQAGLCTTEQHHTCPRLLAALAKTGEGRLPAPDVRFVSTRLVLDPRSPRPLSAASVRRRAVPVGAALALLVAIVGVGLASNAGAEAVRPPSAAVLGGVAGGPTAKGDAGDEELGAAARADATAPATLPSPAAAPAEPPAAEPPAAAVEYVVQPGDTLGAIAATYGVSVEALMAENGLTSEFIEIGQVLRIP